MSDRILLAYATKYGSTLEVSEAIAERLRDGGADVQVTSASDARSLEGFDAVVLGAPLYIGSLLKDAMTFLERNRADLERLPVAVFALGPITAEEDLDEARGQLDAALTKAGWLKPVAKEVFIGKYDPSKLRLADKMLAALPASPLHGLGAHDDRDWSAIRSWADSLPSSLSAAPATR